MSLSALSTKAGSGLKGWHVLAMLLGFFGTIMAVDIGMATMAISTFSGLDGVDSYRRGLDYNQTIADAAQQERLGWTNTLDFAGGGSGLKATFLDSASQPVTNLSISGKIGRGATDHFDHPLTFRETAPGIYEAELGALPPGGWLVALEAHGPAGTYRLKERLWLKKPQ